MNGVSWEDWEWRGSKKMVIIGFVQESVRTWKHVTTFFHTSENILLRKRTDRAWSVTIDPPWQRFLALAGIVKVNLSCTRNHPQEMHLDPSKRCTNLRMMASRAWLLTLFFDIWFRIGVQNPIVIKWDCWMKISPLKILFHDCVGDTQMSEWSSHGLASRKIHPRASYLNFFHPQRSHWNSYRSTDCSEIGTAEWGPFFLNIYLLPLRKLRIRWTVLAKFDNWMCVSATFNCRRTFNCQERMSTITGQRRRGQKWRENSFEFMTRGTVPPR
jgi:hypothetical protein